ncbi:MAG: transposase [Okeania sp. SIO3B3]|nr:transposase [Okeania sp. SIO3B3]
MKLSSHANWKKAQLKIAQLHNMIANIRKDTLHKRTYLSTYLAKNHGQIAIEDLNVSEMMAESKLAKVVADMGFYEFHKTARVQMSAVQLSR